MKFYADRECNQEISYTDSSVFENVAISLFAQSDWIGEKTIYVKAADGETNRHICVYSDGFKEATCKIGQAQSFSVNLTKVSQSVYNSSNIELINEGDFFTDGATVFRVNKKENQTITLNSNDAPNKIYKLLKIDAPANTPVEVVVKRVISPADLKNSYMYVCLVGFWDGI